MKEYAHEYAEFKYRMPDAIETQGGIWPLRMGRNVAKPSYWVGPRSIECYSVHLLVSGSLRLVTPDQELRLKAGDLFCLFPGVSYQYGLDSVDTGVDEHPLQLAWLAFDGPQAALLLKEAGVTHARPYMKQVVDAALISDWQALFSRFEGDGGVGHMLAIQKLMYALFSRIIPEVSAHPEASAYSVDAPRSTPSQKMIAAQTYMNLHFRESISVQEVVRHIGLNRSYFTKSFTEQVGVSPRAYMQQLRMAEARVLLLDTSRSVTDIGLSVGYPDLHSFTRAFIRAEGTSPSAFRASHMSNPHSTSKPF